MFMPIALFVVACAAYLTDFQAINLSTSERTNLKTIASIIIAIISSKWLWQSLFEYFGGSGARMKYAKDDSLLNLKNYLDFPTEGSLICGII